MASSFKFETKHFTLIAALGFAAYACYLLIAPYLGSIVLAFIVSLLFLPMHERIEKRFTYHPNLAATLSCILLTVIIIIPTIFVSIAILQQGMTAVGNTYNWVTQGGAQEILSAPLVQTALEKIDTYLPFDSINQQDILAKAATTASDISTEMFGLSSKILGDVTGILINFLLMVFVLFFLLRDHEKIIQLLRHISPLSRSQEDVLLEEVQKVAKSAVLGSFLTALAQGVIGGIAMTIVGFPGLFWGTMMAFCSFIPVVGTALIWLPTAIYLFLVGEWDLALFLICWGVFVVGSIDNLLRPFLMKGNSGMNTLLIFFSLIGGLHLYGLMGLIYGPIIFAITLVLFRMYETEFQEFLEKQDNS